MKRSMCGLVVLAAATGLWSCNGDPTGDLQGSAPRVVADPSSVFLGQGESQFVEAQVLDEQGNQQAVDFTAQNVGPGITVELDTTFLETTIGTNLETKQRFTVTATAATSTSFELVSGGVSAVVPVKVTPTSATVTLSNPTPAANEELVVTLPVGYRFGAGAGVDVAGDVGIVTAVAPDSSALTVVLPPGATGTLTIQNVEVAYLPGVLLTLPTTETVTVGAATALPGSASTATAPPIPLPAVGGTTATYDVPDFVATPDHFYRFDVAEPGDYTVTVDWDVGSDIDVIMCFDTSCTVTDPSAATGNHPESATYTLAVGTSYLWIQDFGADAAGATVSIVVSR